MKNASQHSLIFLATTFLVNLTSQSGFAFSITPTQPGDSDGTHKYEERYEFRQGVVRLNAWSDGLMGRPFPPDPRRLLQGHVLPIKPGGTDELLERLNARFGNAWEFIPKGDLEGSFNVENYFACGSDFACTDGGITVSDAVGAFFKLNYLPQGNDPTGNSVHWIQRLITNYNVINGRVVEDQIPRDALDILPNAASPYYDESYPGSGSNPTRFFDLPFIQAPYTTKNHYAYFETYLVNEIGSISDSDTGIVKQGVEIYSGVRWGWENEYTPRGYYTDIIGGGIGAAPTGYSPNDDESFGPLPLDFSLDYFGNTYSDFYINNNGNISFGNSLGTYTPTSLSALTTPIIAPYWADVDTRGAGTVTLRTDIPDQVIVTWDNVGYFSQRTDKRASFQLVLRGPNYPIPSDEGNIGFFYKDVEWETGDASGGSGGFGGTQAAAGFGDGASTTNLGEFTLSGSQQPEISQLVSNRSFWFNAPAFGSGSSGGYNPVSNTRGSDGSNPNSLKTGGLGYQLDGFTLKAQENQKVALMDKNTVAVPEPSTVLGTLILASWGGVTLLKREKVDMFPMESSSSNAFSRENSLCIEISEPELIVLPIPAKKLDSSTFVQLRITVTNNARTNFPFVYGILTPELQTSNEQAQHTEKTLNTQLTSVPFDGIGIPPQRSLVRSFTAKLFWRNDKLVFQVFISDYPQIPNSPVSTWSFESLQVETYQLRFIYNSPEEKFLFFDSHTMETYLVNGSRIAPLETPSVNLRFVESVGTDNNTVEVDGIVFETFVPERILSIPDTKFNTRISMQIGIKITNNSFTPLRLTSFDSLIPYLVGPEGLILCESGGGSLGWVGPRESDFRLVMPKESTTFFSDTFFERQANGVLKLIILSSGRTCWLFNNLEFGTYKLQLTYRSLTEKPEVLFEDLWIGMVSTPFVEFHIVRLPSN